MKCFTAKRALTILLIAPLLDVSVSARDEAAIAGIRQVLDGRMTQQTEVRTFTQSDRLYPSVVVRRGRTVRPLLFARTPLPSLAIQSGGRSVSLSEYMADDRIAGLLVLKNDQVVFERYGLGLAQNQRWASWSMAKSISSTLVGAALQQGLIHSLDDPVSRYVPALRGSAYDDVSIRDVLRMSSGVGWSETYTDPHSDCRKLTELQLLHRPGTSMAFMASLKRASPAGTVWNYNSGDANIPGAILEAVTHKSLAAYLSETLWVPLGMQSDATWWTEARGGLGLSGVGLGATLRDYARFGLFVENDGTIDGRRIVPRGWFQQAAAPQTIGGKVVDYGFFWWPLPPGDPIENGAFQAIGIFGQHLYINAREKVVIVVLSARPKPVATPVVSDTDFFTAVAHTLAGPAKTTQASAASTH